MKKLYYPITFALFWTGLLAGGFARIMLKLYHTDFETGFYTDSSAWIPILNLVLAIALVGMFLLNRMKLVGNDYPLLREDKSIGMLSLLSGIALVFFVLEETGWLALTTHNGTLLNGIAVKLCGIAGLLAAGALIAGGTAALVAGRENIGGFVMILPAVWQALSLVLKYNTYITVTTNMDHLLLILFMTVSAMFLIGNARTLCGFARKNGRNYTFPAGLAVALTGLLLTLPNYAYMFRHWSENPVAAMGNMESLYITLFSCYAFASAVRLRRSIAYV